MRGHIDNTVLAVVHKAITGPKFNRRTLQKQLDWNYWLAAEWTQLDNYDKKAMFGAPCTLQFSIGFGCNLPRPMKTTARKSETYVTFPPVVVKP
jgi:hypothetical protein